MSLETSAWRIGLLVMAQSRARTLQARFQFPFQKTVGTKSRGFRQHRDDERAAEQSPRRSPSVSLAGPCLVPYCSLSLSLSLLQQKAVAVVLFLATLVRVNHSTSNKPGKQDFRPFVYPELFSSFAIQRLMLAKFLQATFLALRTVQASNSNTHVLSGLSTG
jgi:hypothetical protein